MIGGGVLFEFLDQSLWLLPQKAIYWSEKRALLLSDLHLAKAGHFQRSGIPIPTSIHQDDLQRLEDLIIELPIVAVYILGDLFHSSVAESESEEFLAWKEKFPAIQWVLVKGNHDYYSNAFYEQLGFEVVQQLTLYPFQLSHEPQKNDKEKLYTLSGHIHPGVRLYGKARQSLSLPCFYFESKWGILPAFGKFTGYVALPLRKTSRVFAIAEQKVFKIAR